MTGTIHVNKDDTWKILYYNLFNTKFFILEIFLGTKTTLKKIQTKKMTPRPPLSVIRKIDIIFFYICGEAARSQG